MKIKSEQLQIVTLNFKPDQAVMVSQGNSRNPSPWYGTILYESIERPGWYYVYSELTLDAALVQWQDLSLI